MENGHLQDDQLFRAVHDRLSDYEAPYNGADWDAMSRSLDQLPKAKAPRWKFSLNSLMAGLAVVGVSVISYALISSTSKNSVVPKSDHVVAAPVQEAASQRQAPAQPLFTASATDQSADAQSATVPVQDASQGNMSQSVMSNSLSSGSGSTLTLNNDSRASRSHKTISDSGLLFGDQIDPRKGFVKQTNEDPTLIKDRHDSFPTVYFDREGNKTNKIILHRDSDGSIRGEKKKFTPPSGDSTPKVSQPGIPTNSDATGFGDFSGNHLP